MKNYTTGRLSPSFLSLGVMFLIIGIWRISVLDWIGILILIIALLILFITFGVIFDFENKKIKKYSAVFGFKKGVWIDISSAKNIFLTEIKQSQTTNLLSISRTDKMLVCKLFITLSDKKIGIITGKKNKITKIANEISQNMKVEIINNIK